MSRRRREDQVVPRREDRQRVTYGLPLTQANSSRFEFGEAVTTRWVVLDLCYGAVSLVTGSQFRRGGVYGVQDML
jgi:hypothetical protein